MRTAGPRIEFIRFSLLIVLTVALVSVAIRINSSNTAHTSAPPARTPSTSSSAPSSSAPSSGAPSSGAPSSASGTAPASTTSPGTGTGTGTGSGGPGGGTSAGGSPQMLPVTGDDAIRLAGLAALLLAGGAAAIGTSRRPQRATRP